MFTTEEQRIALGKRVKKYEQMMAMKKRRLDGMRNNEFSQNLIEECEGQAQTTEETRADEIEINESVPQNIEGLVTNTVDNLTFAGNEIDTLTDDNIEVAQNTTPDKAEELQQALQQIKEFNSNIAKIEARTRELEKTVAEFNDKENVLKSKIHEIGEKNANVERVNGELKERIANYEAKFKEQCDIQSTEALKEIQKKITKLESKCLTMENLKDNEKLVKFYTGLPDYDTLMAVFDLACKCLPSTTQHGLRKLTNDDEFLLTLVKLRLNLRSADLGFRFGIVESTVSAIIHKWLNVLYVSLKFLIRWPTREEVRATLPECFRPKFHQAVVIIDCTEVFIERATNLLARSQTWSNYKSHNTIKYLIGITPQGTVSFVSKAWGGRVSDKQITQECGILDLLLPGDLVLADRGFNIFELVGMHKAEAKLPAFTKGKTQLSAKEVQESRELAVVRIHVERLIGVIKQKYSILEGTLPINFIKADGLEVSVADKLMTICCALVNLCEPLVSNN